MATSEEVADATTSSVDVELPAAVVSSGLSVEVGADGPSVEVSQVADHPKLKMNPVSQVAAALFVADVQVTVRALGTAVQVVHSPALSHVPASQVAATLSEADVHVTLAALVTGVHAVHVCDVFWQRQI